MTTTSGEYWLISVPGEKGTSDAWEKLNRGTGNLAVNSKFAVPDLKVLYFPITNEGNSGRNSRSARRTVR